MHNRNNQQCKDNWGNGSGLDRIYTEEGLLYTQPKKFWVGTPPGQRRGGRPRRSWRKMIEDETETVGKTTTEAWKQSPLMLLRGGAMLRSGLTQIY
jgi:hypothetical protein